MNKNINLVRNRPAVIFGSKEKKGAICSIKFIITEFLLCCDKLEISIDEDNYIIVRAKNVDLLKLRNWHIVNRDDVLNDNNRNISDYIVFMSVCEELEICNYLESCTSPLVEVASYKDGEMITSKVRTAEYNEINNITLKFKISHDIFEYDNITISDLDFINVIKEVDKNEQGRNKETA